MGQCQQIHHLQERILTLQRLIVAGQHARAGCCGKARPLRPAAAGGAKRTATSDAGANGPAKQNTQIRELVHRCSMVLHDMHGACICTECGDYTEYTSVKPRATITVGHACVLQA